MPDAPLFFLIAGEASGDLLGARLMQALRKLTQGNAHFAGIGGPRMRAEGIELIFPQEELAYFGLFELLHHVPQLLRRMRQTVAEVKRLQPAALITIDAPDFCFRVARQLKGEGIPLIHYVAPTVWAWRPGRARKIADFLDHLLALLPFEPPYFTREGLGCTFVGHPIVESGAGLGDGARFRAKYNIGAHDPLIALLPGSRRSEISRLLPIFADTIQRLRTQHPQLRTVMPVTTNLAAYVRAETKHWPVSVAIVECDEDKYDAFAAARAALACSGTIAIELAMAQLPAIIAYKVSPLTHFLYHRFIKAKYANLVNIMHDRLVVPELLQENSTPEKLAAALNGLLTDETARQRQIAGLADVAGWLGQGHFVPSERAAQTVLDVVTRPRALTVLQVIPALVTGGVERGTVEVAAALVAAGHKAIVASAGGPMVREIEDAGAMHVTLPLKTKNPFVMYGNIKRLGDIIRRHNVDIVHARSRAPAWSAWAAAARADKPFVTTFHNVYGMQPVFKRAYNSVMARGARVIAISNFVGAHAAKVYGVPPSRLRMIPRGVDIRRFDPSTVDGDRVTALRRQWHVPDGVPIIMLPGRLARWKGQLVLVEALAKLGRQDIYCAIVGGGSRHFRREIEDMAAHNGIGPIVHAVDNCRDMPAALMLADVVVAPSTRPEGFGRVIAEAQAMGRPVIAADHGGARETIVPDKTGFLVPPGDAGALARAIEVALALKDEEKAALAARSIAHIRARFTTAMMTEATLAVYGELMQKRMGNANSTPGAESRPASRHAKKA